MGEQTQGIDPVQAAIQHGMSFLNTPNSSGAGTLPTAPSDVVSAGPSAPLGVDDSAPPPATPQTSAETAPAPQQTDQDIESELLKQFDFKVTDLIPQDVLDQLIGRAKKGWSLTDAFGIAGIAMTNPELAGQLMRDIEHNRNVSVQQLSQLGRDVSYARKEGARQVAMYMRSRKDAADLLTRYQGEQKKAAYLQRSKEVSAFTNDVRDAGIDPVLAGIPPITKDILNDDEKYADWVNQASEAVGKYRRKLDFYQEMAGAKKGPAYMAAKMGIDPTNAVTEYARNVVGLPEEEITALQPTFSQFAKTAKQQVDLVDAQTQRLKATVNWMNSSIDKNKATIEKLNKEVQGVIGGKGAITPSRAAGLITQYQRAQMVASAQAMSAQKLLESELAKGGWPGAQTDPQLVMMYQEHLANATDAVAVSEQMIQQLTAVAQGQSNDTTKIPLILDDIGPKLAESSRSMVATGKLKAPGATPEMLAQAQAAAASPATWLTYLKGPPLENGRQNPYRTMYWASLVNQLGSALGGTYSPEDLILLLDAARLNGASYADAYSNQDITLPAQDIEQMLGSIKPGTAPPNSPAGGSQQQ